MQSLTRSISRLLTPPLAAVGSSGADASSHPGRDAQAAAIVAFVVLVAAAVVLTIASFVLSGWIVSSPGLIRLGLGGGAMAPNAALGLLAAGLALALCLDGRRIWAVPTVLLALVPLTLGALTLAQYVLGLDLGIDQIVSADVHGAVRTGHRARMAPLAALALLLAGTALALAHRHHGRLAGASAWLGLPLLVLALLTLFGQGFDATLLLRSSGAGGIAPTTVAALLALAVALLCLRPERGPAAIFLAPGGGGRLARRLLPAAIVVPPVIGWLLLQGVARGTYGIEGFAALTAILTFLALAGISWSLAQTMEQRFDAERAAQALVVRNERLLDQVQEASHLGGWAIDVGSGAIHWTREVYRIHEVGPEHDPNDLQRNLDFYLPDDRERVAAAVTAACERGEPWELESQLCTATGRLRWVRTGGRAEWQDARIVRVHGYIMDISEHHELLRALDAAGATLRQANAGLEQRVAERTHQLQTANQEMEAFAYSVSHDLRAPLRSIDGFARILEEDCALRLDDEGRDALHRVRANAQKMGILIDEMLKLSRLSRAEFNAETVDLGEIARTVAAELQAAEPARQVSFDIAAPVPAHGDRQLLTVVLDNLMANAWKFTSKHATARIEFGTGSFEGEPTHFVRDDGAGFDMAHVGNLFAPFQRLHGTGEFPGTGIGLSIVRRIVLRHGGRVWAEGAVEQGATFHFTLPAAPAGSAHARSEP